jgi:hypothetical protein
VNTKSTNITDTTSNPASDPASGLDYYDHAIRFFAKNPDRIEEFWNCPAMSPFGFLFSYIEPSNNTEPICGCPSQIAATLAGKTGWKFYSYNHLMDAEIMKMDFPHTPDAITPADLPKFAAIQRRADEIYEREAPVLTGGEVRIINSGYVYIEPDDAEDEDYKDRAPYRNAMDE